MGLIKAVSQAMRPQYAQAQSNSSIAVSGLKASASSIEAISRGSVKNSGRIAAIVPLIGGKRIDQKQADSVAARMGAIRHDAAMLRAVQPHIIAGAKAFVEAETMRVSMVKTVAEATQKVAVLNSKAQAETFMGHAQAHSQVTFWQSAHHGDFAV